MEQAYRLQLEAQLAELVQQTSVPSSPSNAHPAKFDLSSSALPGTPKAQVQRGVVRSSSVDAYRPAEKGTLPSVRTSRTSIPASLRSSRSTQQTASGSLLRASSLSMRPISAAWDPRVLAKQAESKGGVVANKKLLAAAMGGVQKGEVVVEPDPEQPANFSPSSGYGPGAALRLRPSTAPGMAGNAPLVTPRAKAGPSRTAVGKSAFGGAAVAHQPRSPRVSHALGYVSSAPPVTCTDYSDVAVESGRAPVPVQRMVSVDQDPEALARERERARLAARASAAWRQSAADENRAREEEQRRRAAAIKERARVDRETARASGRVVRPISAAASEVLESAWVTG